MVKGLGAQAYVKDANKIFLGTLLLFLVPQECENPRLRNTGYHSNIKRMMSGLCALYIKSKRQQTL